jgi:hypothetical protein
MSENPKDEQPPTECPCDNPSGNGIYWDGERYRCMGVCPLYDSKEVPQ